jgi:hypothetical protein
MIVQIVLKTFRILRFPVAIHRCGKHAFASTLRNGQGHRQKGVLRAAPTAVLDMPKTLGAARTQIHVEQVSYEKARVYR